MAAAAATITSSNQMEQPGLEQISANCDIIIPIFHMLTFKQQLRLAQVSATLRSVFERFIWPQEYRSLKLFEFDADGQVVSNETETNKLCLSHRDLKEFLSVYAASVHELTTSYEVHIAKFQNLTSLLFHVDFAETGREFKIRLIDLLDDLPDLESLQLICRTNGMAPKPELISSLFRWKRLRRLCWDFSAPDSSRDGLKYKDFCKIVLKMKLEVLQLSNPVRPDDGCPLTANSTKPKPLTLKELQIDTSLKPHCEYLNAMEFFPQISSTQLPLFLQILPNLTTLSVRMTDEEVTDDVLQKIATSCQKLQKFVIRDTTFTNIQSFWLPTTVEELHVENCAGLSYTNLKQLLSESNIRKFHSRRTTWKAQVFEDFRISPLINTLELDAADCCEYRWTFNKTGNLINVLRFSADDNKIVIAVAQDLSSSNLENLHVVAGSRQLPLDVILQQKHLRKLTTSLDTSTDVASYITALLKHPSLVELTLDNVSELTCQSQLDKGFPTNITSLQLSVDIFEAASDFWLDLFLRNVTIKITIRRSVWHMLDAFKAFVRSLINHKRFPTSLRTIAVMGFNIDCDDLRQNLEQYLNRLFSRSLQGPVHNLSNKHDIILCRNVVRVKGRKLIEHDAADSDSSCSESDDYDYDSSTDCSIVI